MEPISETYVKCPVCGAYSVLVDNDEDFESRICITCGFTTNSMLAVSANQIEIFEASQPKLVKALKKYDKDLDSYWYPLTIHVETMGALYPEGTEESYVWAYAKSVPIPVQMRLQYPIPNTVDKYYESRLQVDNPMRFDSFSDAYKRFRNL